MRNILLLFMVLLAVACDELPTSDGDQEDLVFGPVYDWHVSDLWGSDTNSGSLSDPFKTITKALAMAGSGETIKVFPGLYGLLNGEVFPLVVPQGVILVGHDEIKGADTIILGGVDLGGASACIRTGSDVIITGFTVTNNVAPASGQVFGIEITQPNVTIRNSTIRNCGQNSGFGGSAGVILHSGGDNARIVGCRVIDNSQEGLEFNNAGAGTRIEGSEFRGNRTGIAFQDAVANVDMGGGGGSSGGNIFSCNLNEDIQLLPIPVSVTVNAKNNYWDHVPPSASDLGSLDHNWTVVTTGALVATDSCP